MSSEQYDDGLGKGGAYFELEDREGERSSRHQAKTPRQWVIPHARGDTS